MKLAQRLLLFAVVTLAHLAASYASLFIGGGMIMSAFDGKGSTASAIAASAVMSILAFPIVNGLSDVVPFLRHLGTDGQNALFLANSVVWGAAATAVWSWWRARRSGVAGA